jgi:uncharacterized protein involved in response to NO
VALAAVAQGLVGSTEAGLWLAAVLWPAGFATFVVLYAPALAAENAGHKRSNPKAG